MMTLQKYNNWLDYERGRKKLLDSYDRFNQARYPLPNPELKLEKKPKVSYWKEMKHLYRGIYQLLP